MTNAEIEALREQAAMFKDCDNRQLVTLCALLLEARADAVAAWGPYGDLPQGEWEALRDRIESYQKPSSERDRV